MLLMPPPSPSTPPRLTVKLAGRVGFTLIEILIVTTIIVVLMTLLLGALRGARENARRGRCASNVGQLAKASLEHARGHVMSAYVPTRSKSDDSLAWIYPNYVSDPQVAVCPSTQNVVRDDLLLPEATALADFGMPKVLEHLTRNAANAADSSGAHSYEIQAWFDGPNSFALPGGRVVFDARNTDGNRQRGIRPGEFGYNPAIAMTRNVLKTSRNLPITDSKVFLYLDGDSGSGPGDRNNWPDAANNHGTDGLNVGFADGHAAWINTGPELIETYFDAGQLTNDFLDRAFAKSIHPGFAWMTISHYGTTVTEYSLDRRRF